MVINNLLNFTTWGKFREVVIPVFDRGSSNNINGSKAVTILSYRVEMAMF